MVLARQAWQFVASVLAFRPPMRDHGHKGGTAGIEGNTVEGGTLPLFKPDGDDLGFDALMLSPYTEMGAYERLWNEPATSFKSLARRFCENRWSLPSSYVDREEAIEHADAVYKVFSRAQLRNVGICVYGMASYPERLREAEHPVQLLYYEGYWDLVFSSLVSVVGTRRPTMEGRVTTRHLVEHLVSDGHTIVSGLAKGIDTEAHKTALACEGKTIAVLGTPLSETYPKENYELQRLIAEDNLVISQVPLLRYASKNYRWNRVFFPERNITMAALSKATIIVEAGPTSGTRIQARAALKQGRKLLIMDHCFYGEGAGWADKFVERGAIRVKSYEDVSRHLSPTS